MAFEQTHTLTLAEPIQGQHSGSCEECWDVDYPDFGVPVVTGEYYGVSEQDVRDQFVQDHLDKELPYVE